MVLRMMKLMELVLFRCTNSCTSTWEHHFLLVFVIYVLPSVLFEFNSQHSFSQNSRLRSEFECDRNHIQHRSPDLLDLFVQDQYLKL